MRHAWDQLLLIRAHVAKARLTDMAGYDEERQLLEREVTCNVTFSEEQKRQLLYVTGFTGIGSVLCCAIAISMVLLFRLCTRFAYRLATYQVIGSLFWSISCGLVLLQLNYDPTSESSRVSCHVVAFLLEYTMWVKLGFTLWLTFHLFCYVVLLKNLKWLEWLYIASSVFFPLVFIVWIPFIHDDYGIAGAWCFIRVWKGDCATEKYDEGIAETFALFYGPIVVSLGLNAIAVITMVIVMVRRACGNNGSDEKEPLLVEQNRANVNALKQLLPLLAYPVIYFTLVLFPVINRLYDAFGNSTGFSLIITQGATIAIMGFFAGLALIIHICCLNLVQSTSKSKARKETDNLASRNPSSTYANMSTTKTWFSLKRESEVDENLRHSTGIN